MPADGPSEVAGQGHVPAERGSENISEEVRESEESIKKKCLDQVRESEESIKEKCSAQVRESEESIKEKCSAQVTESEESIKEKCSAQVRESEESIKEKCSAQVRESEESIKEKCSAQVRESEESIKEKCSAQVTESEESIKEKCSAQVTESEESIKEKCSAQVTESEELIKTKCSAQVTESEELIKTKCSAQVTESEELIKTKCSAQVTESEESIKKNISDEDRELDSYREIENLWRIENGNPLFKLALAEWRRIEQEFDHRQSRRESKSIDLHTQIHNIIGWYAVFQGVLLTAVSQLTAGATPPAGVPVCGKIWFPIVLSGFGTLVTIIGLLRLFSDLKSLETTINSEKNSKAEVGQRAGNLKRLGPQKFKFRVHTKNNLKFQDQDFWRNWRNKVAVIVSLLVFTALFILSYFVILCDTWVIRKWDKGLPGY
ncbi:hypothetical protein KC19_9G184300 [Ceratodon purpureus]|uniref:Uncharacterized protein n=1 Tax=Ceratodon purpureus TaxID=3225 RepID=A0A8T0GXU0_CERPU|nr:hypothetical protein KC19_9G184300 [Ceratodon purpureus]